MRYSQPQGVARIDWANPIAAKTCAIALPVPGGAIAFSNTSPVTRVNRYSGPGISTLSTIDGLGCGSKTAHSDSLRLHPAADVLGTGWDKPSTAVTFFALAVRFGNAVGNAPIFGNLAPSHPPYYAYGIADSGGTGTLQFNLGVPSGLQSIDIPSGFSGRIQALAGRYDSVTFNAFVDGVKSSTSIATSGSVTYPVAGSTRGPVIGNFYDLAANRAFNGAVLLAVLFPTTLSDAEIKSLSDNPWQIFADNRRPIFVGLGAAPAGDTYTLTADSVSVALSGQAATLSANRVIPADTASVAFSGQAATLTRGYAIAADTASIAVAGQAASLLSNKVLPLITASLAFAGQDATLTYSPSGVTYALFLDSSLIPFIGNDVTFPYLPPAPLTQSGSGGSGGAFKVRRSKEFNDLINTIVAKAGNIPAVVAKSAPPQASPEKLELVVAALEDVAVWVNKRKRAVIAAEVIQLQERLQELEDEEQAVALLLLS